MPLSTVIQPGEVIIINDAKVSVSREVRLFFHTYADITFPNGQSKLRRGDPHTAVSADD